MSIMSNYEQYEPMVASIARSVRASLPRSVEVEDLAQIGRFALWRACESADPERAGSFLVYACVRIRGAMLDSIRGREYREAQREACAARSEPDRAGSQKRDIPDPFLSRAVAALRPSQRVVLEMRFSEQRSQSETAAALGVSRRTVRREEASGLGELRRRLAA